MAPNPAPHSGNPASCKQATLDEIEALEKAFPEPPTQPFEFLYSSLSILDSKASSLMGFNAIGLTALAVWLEYIPLNWLHLALDIVFLLFLFSSIICFFVVKVYWSPAGHFKEKQLQMVTLLETRNHRTRLYRTSWMLSVLAVGILTMVSLVHAAGTAFRASGKCNENCQELYSEKFWGNRELPSGVPNSENSTVPTNIDTPAKAK